MKPLAHYQTLITRHHLALTALFAALLSAAGPFMEWYFTITPCPMCWWQRYCHYTILAAALTGLLGQKWPQNPLYLVPCTLYLILLAAATGLTIAIWQFSAQHHWLPFPETCKATAAALSDPTNLLAAMQKPSVIPCEQDTFRLFGLSLAGWNIPAMAFVLVLNVLSVKSIKTR